LAAATKSFATATKNFAAATKRFVDRTKHFVVATKNIFVIPILTNDFVGITKPFIPCLRWNVPYGVDSFFDEFQPQAIVISTVDTYQKVVIP